MINAIDPAFRSRLQDPLWRLRNLYWIENKSGRVRRFRMNAAQQRLHANLWYRNVVLKARQLGISTYVAMLMLDSCLFTPNFHAGIIDKTLPDAEQKLEKIRFAWEHLDYLPPQADEAGNPVFHRPDPGARRRGNRYGGPASAPLPHQAAERRLAQGRLAPRS